MATNNTNFPLRWGIVSTGLISTDFLIAMTALNPEEHIAAAVGARNIADAEKFAKEHNIPKWYGSYKDLFADKDIDVIYIGSIHPAHLPLAKQALDAGKHVLCEKPLCMNVRETVELLAYAKEKKLFLMEAIWVRHFPIYKKLIELINNKDVVGDVKNLIITFGIPIGEKDSLKYPALGGGCTLAMGVYCFQLALLVFGNEKPEILASGHLNECGADENVSVTLKYSGGRMATFTMSYSTLMPNEAFIVGTKGTIKMHSMFLCTTKLEEIPSGKTYKYSMPIGKKTPVLDNSMGLSYQCLETGRCIREGLLESELVSHSDSLLLAEITESVRKQVGVVYEQD